MMKCELCRHNLSNVPTVCKRVMTTGHDSLKP